MIIRVLLGAALTLLVASGGHAQQPTEPPAMQPAMDCMMHAMQGMQGMQGGMAMPAQSAPGREMNMHGMQANQAAGSMECGCAGCARAGFSALLGKGAGALTLTTEQTTELDAIMGRAREAALAVLTAEQRDALEAQAAAPAGGCMNGGTGTAAEPQH